MSSSQGEFSYGDDRDDFQRKNVGPVVNYMALQIINVTQAPVLAERRVDESFNLYILTEAADAAISSLTSMMESRMIRWRSYRSVDQLFRKRTLQGQITHYSNASEVVQEGLRSGIVMPAQAALTKYAEGRDHDPRLAAQIDARIFAGILRDRGFHAALLRLAHAPNGFYLQSSTEITLINPEYLRNRFDVKPFFDGKVLSAQVMNALRAGRDGCAGKKSSGCPVRYKSYPELGNYALAFAEEEGIDRSALQHAESSAIVAGSVFLANTIRQA